MSCYHPLLGVPNYDHLNDDHKRTYDILPYSTYCPEDRLIYPGAISIPCGHCIGCRLDYSRSWADRMMLELDHYKGKAIFVTLTYDNEHVPITFDDNGEVGYFSLWKPDLQKFFKRLRKKFSDKEIRYYAAGEYGSTTFRPHYHAIIFGLSLEDFSDLRQRGLNDLKQAHFESSMFQAIWSQGFCLLAAVSWQTCAYVSRYVTKKVFAAELPIQDLYDCEPEFSLMSRRPGIGASYMADHPDMFDQSNIYVRGHDKPISIPKYFLNKLELTDPVLADKIRNQRAQFVHDKELLKMQQTELSYIEQLEVEENKKLLRTQALKRLL